MRVVIFHVIALLAAVSATKADANDSVESICRVDGGRSVVFETTQGSSMNLDISPDGRQLAFDILGDIYIMPVTGGEATQVTSGEAWDARPVWSPDGTRIAFISDRGGSRDGIYTTTLGATRKIKELMSESQEAPGDIGDVIKTMEWVPDSNDYVVNGFFGYRFSVDPSGRVESFKLSQSIYDMFVNNGRSLFHLTPTGTDDDKSPQAVIGSLDRAYRILEMDSGVDGWRETSDVVASNGWEPPLLSRDGRWLVYRDIAPLDGASASTIDEDASPYVEAVHAVRVYDKRTHQDRMLVGIPRSDGWRDDGERGGFSARTRYAMSPDSRFLFLAYGGKIHRIDIESGKDEILPFRARVNQCLDPLNRFQFEANRKLREIKSIRSITASPDESQLVFSALRRLYVMDEADQRPRALVDQSIGQFQPAYSPDGRWIAFVTWSAVEGGHVWRFSSDGRVLERLTAKAGYYQSPVWAPDGKSIAFIGSNDIGTERAGFAPHDGGELHLLSIKHRELTVLPVSARFGGPISFSGNGDRIFFVMHTSSRFGAKLASVSIDRFDVRESGIQIGSPNTRIEAAVVSPSGKDAAIAKLGNLYLIRCSTAIDVAADADCIENQITFEGGHDPRWRDHGAVLEWSFGQTYVRSRLSPAACRDANDSCMKALKPYEAARQEKVEVNLVVPTRIVPTLLAIKGANIVTMRGAEVIDNGTIIVKDGRIEQIGPADRIRVPDGAEVIIVDGKTIIPGLIDVHAHLTVIPRDLLVENHWEPLAYLAFGVTTARDPSNGGEHGFAYGDLVEVGGMVGPRIFGTTAMVPSNFRIESYEDAVNSSKQMKALGATFTKYHSGWNRQQQRWIIRAAREVGLNVAAHLPYKMGRFDLSTIADGATTSEHDITYDTDLFEDAKQFLVSAGVSVDYAPLGGRAGYPSLYWSALKDDMRVRNFLLHKAPAAPDIDLDASSYDGLLPAKPSTEASARFLADLMRRGGRVMIGSHGDYDGIGMHWEMWVHVRGGMTPYEVLRAATINGAYGLGMESDLGSLEVGKIADLLILGKNPLEDIRNTLTIESVMKDGVLRDSMTLDEIWPNRTPLPAWRYLDPVEVTKH